MDDIALNRYELLGLMGKGSKGNVWKANDKLTGNRVLVKKMYGAFMNTEEASRIFRELMFLCSMRNNDYIINVLDIIISPTEQDVYIVYEHEGGVSFKDIIEQGILGEIHQQCIFYQLVLSVHHLHSGDLIHGDITSGGILINEACSLKLFNLGQVTSIHSPVKFFHDSSCWYKAPELLCGAKTSKKSDIWAIGCVLGEMLRNDLLFWGINIMQQLENIVKTIGYPSDEELKSVESEFTLEIFKDIPNNPIVSLKELLPSANDIAIDLLTKILQFNANNRIDTFTILNHPYLAQFYNPNDIKICDEPVRILLDDENIYTYSISDYRTKIRKELLNEIRTT